MRPRRAAADPRTAAQARGRPDPPTTQRRAPRRAVPRTGPGRHPAGPTAAAAPPEPTATDPTTAAAAPPEPTATDPTTAAAAPPEPTATDPTTAAAAGSGRAAAGPIRFRRAAAGRRGPAPAATRARRPPGRRGCPRPGV